MKCFLIVALALGFSGCKTVRDVQPNSNVKSAGDSRRVTLCGFPNNLPDAVILEVAVGEGNQNKAHLDQLYGERARMSENLLNSSNPRIRTSDDGQTLCLQQVYVSLHGDIHSKCHAFYLAAHSQAVGETRYVKIGEFCNLENLNGSPNQGYEVVTDIRTTNGKIEGNYQVDWYWLAHGDVLDGWNRINGGTPGCPTLSNVTPKCLHAEFSPKVSQEVRSQLCDSNIHSRFQMSYCAN